MKGTEKMKFVEGSVENIVGKGENAGYQHFLNFPQCFQRAFFSGSLKVGIVWERVKLNKNGKKFSKRVENTEGKGEIARYEQFLLFPQCFQKTYAADM